MKDNCLDSQRYVKAESGRFRLEEALSIELANRSGKWGLKLSEMVWDIKRCGKHGECQVHRENGDERLVVYRCNQRSVHIPCAIAYRRGQGIEMRNQYSEIVKALGLWGFYNYTFTLPGGIRAWIDQNPEEAKSLLADVRRAISMTIKKLMGLNGNKTRKVQPGFSVVYHPSSSGNPYVQSSHFHAIILPIVANLKSGSVTRLPRRLDHTKVKSAYREQLNKVLEKHGLGAMIEGRYVVHLRYTEMAYPSSVDHAFKYANRSQAQDVLQTIRKVHDHFENFVCTLKDKKEDVLHPCVKSLDQVVDALEFVLNPIVQVRLSYGFMRRLDDYADLLKIERDDYHDDDNWEFLYEVELFRVARGRWDKEKNKVVTFITVYVRRKGSADEWTPMNQEDLRGEKAMMGGRKLYRAKVKR